MPPSSGPIDRDTATRRLRRVNRWLIAGSVALTGVFAEAAASAFPGRSDAKATSRDAGSGKTTTTKSSPTGSANKVEPPATAPEAVDGTSTEEDSQAERSTPAEASGSTSVQTEQAGSQEAETATSESSSTESSRSTESTESSSASSTAETPVVSGGS